MNDTFAHGAKRYFNATDELECRTACISDLNCVAIDIIKKQNPLRCWPHYEYAHLLAGNLYDRDGATLFIPVKRCIANLRCKYSCNPADQVFSFKAVRANLIRNRMLRQCKFSKAGMYLSFKFCGNVR